MLFRIVCRISAAPRRFASLVPVVPVMRANAPCRQSYIAFSRMTGAYAVFIGIYLCFAVFMPILLLDVR